MKERISWIEKMKAYRLMNKFAVTIALAVVVIISVVLYLTEWVQSSEILKELFIAIFTSLLVSILIMDTEIYVEYKDNERDQFLEDIHTFGIANLNKNKEEVIRDLLTECDSTIWISGYRLIMTNNLKSHFAAAVERGATGTAILCPPWTEAFKLVYGEYEKVMNNYFEVFHAISEARKVCGKPFHVYISEKPIFSDTYKIDQKLITGPYMHNTDSEYGRIMAKDFFSYNLSNKKSRLYELVENEFNTLVNDSSFILDWDEFDKAYEKRQKGDYNEAGQIKLFREAFIPVRKGEQ